MAEEDFVPFFWRKIDDGDDRGNNKELGDGLDQNKRSKTTQTTPSADTGTTTTSGIVPMNTASLGDSQVTQWFHRLDHHHLVLGAMLQVFLALFRWLRRHGMKEQFRRLLLGWRAKRHNMVCWADPLRWDISRPI